MMLKKKKKRTSLFARISILALALCAAFTLISMQLEVAALQRDIDSVNNNIVKQRLDNDELDKLLSIEESDEYVERIARDKLGFCYPDEKILVDRSGN